MCAGSRRSHSIPQGCAGLHRRDARGALPGKPAPEHLSTLASLSQHIVEDIATLYTLGDELGR